MERSLGSKQAEPWLGSRSGWVVLSFRKRFSHAPYPAPLPPRSTAAQRLGPSLPNTNVISCLQINVGPSLTPKSLKVLGTKTLMRRLRGDTSIEPIGQRISRTITGNRARSCLRSIVAGYETCLA